LIKFGGVTIDPAAYGSQGSAVLGIRDSGKTYTATELAERLFEAGIPFVAFDPIGVWRFLRVPGAGRGYPIVVAGGKAGDLPLTVASAPEYVRAAMRDGVSLVIDLFDINLSKADWKRIVTACVRVLLHENSQNGLRHIFIEEAAEFAPQRVGPDQGQVYAEIEKLARMGGNSRLGYTLINQRAEEVNKAVLELCDNLFLHRQKGRNSLTALSKWLDIGNVKEHKEIIGSLSTLPTGECWAWLAGTERPVLIKVPKKNSLHPDRRTMRGDGDAQVKAPVDVGTFVSSMRASLGKIEEEAKANDPAVLRKRIAELERQLRERPTVAPAADHDAIKAAAFSAGFNRAAALVKAEVSNVIDALRCSAVDAGNRFDAFLEKLPQPAIAIHPQKGISPATERALGAVAHAARKELRKVNGAARADISGPQQVILDRLGVLHDRGIYPPSRATLAAFCRVSPSSSGYEKNLGVLKSKALIEYPQPNYVAFTDDGRASSRPQDDGRPAHVFWLSIVNAPKAAILQALMDAHPSDLSREDLAAEAGVSALSSGFEKNLGELRTLGAVDYPARGRVALTRHVIPT
jgi:uncharacterized protein